MRLLAGPEGSCNGCHGGPTGQYWPDGSVNNAQFAYVEDSANGASRHDNHVLAASRYLYGLSTVGALTGAAPTGGMQKHICGYCHGANPGGGGHNVNAWGDSRVDLAGAGQFRRFTGTSRDALDAGSAAYGSAAQTCATLACHNLVTTPTGTGNWEGAAGPVCASTRTGVRAAPASWPPDSTT